MDAAGVSVAEMTRFNIDVGLREEENNRETFRAVSGLRGEFGEGYSFEAFANYGRTTVERVNLNNRIDERWIAATDAVFVDQAGADAIDVNDNTVADSRMYFDLGGTCSLDNGLALGFTVDNVLDEDPPFGLFGNSGESGLNDTVGRFYVVRASRAFGDRR